jgi:hypothetical protein
MKAGVLGVVDGTFDSVDSIRRTVSEDGRDLHSALEIDRVFSLPTGGMAFAGRAAQETLADRSTASISADDIDVTETTRTVTTYTEFVGVPGEFVVVASGDGTIAFDLIAAETGTDIERATLDLDAFFASHGDATPWKCGFYSTGDDGVNGIFHGDDLRENRDLDALLSSSSLNQLGLAYDYGGDEVKMTASSSGYVELYRPAEFDDASYLAYLDAEIRPVVV